GQDGTGRKGCRAAEKRAPGCQLAGQDRWFHEYWFHLFFLASRVLSPVRVMVVLSEFIGITVLVSIPRPRPFTSRWWLVCKETAGQRRCCRIRSVGALHGSIRFHRSGIQTQPSARKN